MQMTNVGYRSDFELTKDTPYLALTVELWSVFCEYFGEKLPCYEGSLLYLIYVPHWHYRVYITYKPLHSVPYIGPTSAQSGQRRPW